MNKPIEKHTPEITDLEIPQSNDIPNHVIPLFATDKEQAKSSHLKIIYDVVMLVLLVMDLVLIILDNILMSGLVTKIAPWLGVWDMVSVYRNQYHLSIAAIGGAFTLFWVCELLARWALAIKKQTYYRWFFFPFVHWYEMLACIPMFRALRLLRAGIIIKRLHDTGIKIIPDNWLKSAQFYYHVMLEELSDRVILTAIDNFRAQMASSSSHEALIQKTLDDNRLKLEKVVLGLLRSELSPKLQQAFLSQAGERLSYDIGESVERALMDTPEFRKYLKLIPIAGSMIEAQITNVGRHIGENVTSAVNQHLFDEKTLDALMVQVAKGVANIDTSRPEIKELVSGIVEDALSGFEKQIKIQQWKHKSQLHL